MNNPELRAVLTEALSRSYYRIVGSSSDCRVDPGEILADALLSLPGVAVIQLPEVDRGWATRNAWTVDESYVVAETDVGVVLEGDDTVTALRVETATRLAAALLAAAAAVVATGEEHHG
ncbi:hypothetical protein SCOTTMCG_15 [Mycobacterium phage ScottMcG]|uniref:Uncharacterized protein n=1 Tax=Mycobacterium phage ScottMcG TaxID=546807 RepID=B5LKZ7_9CAUD|nr:hypothetical protein SCOTTMCG_15 [Mycobacterium phage ScottMcG]ACH62694.1 hypothetical protein SCOTTMCG_15 [Mycobacterium phage ScottMcG]